MSVPAGYKATEVGAIPNDWDVVPLSILGQFSKGQGIRKDQASSGEIPCVRYGELYTDHNDVVRIFRSRISRKVAATSKLLRKGDLLFAGSGETKEEIGKCVAFIDDVEAFAGGDLIILSPRAADSVFLGYLLNSDAIVRQKAARAQGDMVVHISARALAEVVIPLPPTVSEQTAIAEGLSDVDEAIAAVDAVIAKKRALKTATMQALLSGTHRLPGFSGGWTIQALGKCLKVRHGKSQGNVEEIKGKYPILATGGEIGRASEYLHPGPSVLIGRKGTIDRPQYSEGPFWSIDTLFYTEIDPSADSKFLFYKFQMIDWRTYNEASGVPSLSSSTIEAIEVEMPKRDEQSAIADTLTDLDLDLKQSEAKLSKLRRIKTGMMQQLLTGKIRLT